jgi:NAD-dependent dihydropyrimidine dehydrogenase PreA subunit
MAKGETAKQSKVLFCNCAYFDVIPQATKERVFTLLQEAGADVETVGDLCGLAAQRDSRLAHWAQADALAIVACFPRAVRWLFEAAGVNLDAEKVQIFNMRTQSPDEIVSGLPGEGTGSDRPPALPGKKGDWVPWFPVIDHDRCKNCKQCMNFCLFGVYGLSDEGQVQVQNPAGCKTNCPACARMCPAQAIIFPKYADAPINGDEVTESAGAAGKPTPDLRAMLKQGNVYDRIRRREPGQKRFSTEPRESSTDAACPTIESLRRDLDIPDEVLASLSPAELQRIGQTSRQNRADEPPDRGSD